MSRTNVTNLITFTVHDDIHSYEVTAISDEQFFRFCMDRRRQMSLKTTLAYVSNSMAGAQLVIPITRK